MRNSKYFVVVLGLLVSIFLVYGCGVKSQYLTSAKIYLKLRPPDYDNAVKQLQLELEHNPENAEAHFLLGKIYSDKRMYPEMAKHFDSSLELSPLFKKEIQEIREDKWVAMFNSGVADADKDSLEKALEKFKMAIIIDPTRYESYLNAAAQTMKMDNCEQALKYSNEAYNVKPDDIKVLNAQAQISFNCKEYDKSIEVYRKLLQMDPQNVNAYINMATIFELLRLPDSSKVAYDKVVELDPNYKDAYYNRGILYLNEAIRMYKTLVTVKDSMEQNPKDQRLIDKSKQLVEKQKEFYNLAETDFQKAVDLDPDDLEALQYLGQSLFQQEKTDKAIEILEKVVEINPDNKEVWSTLSIAYTKKGWREKAMEAAEKAEGQ
ncbi:MAG: tetratricopeptide repeat protein [Candidatus Zixiibacteriota bacterium]